jgi:hypothetical protein
VRAIGLAAIALAACHGQIRFDDQVVCTQDIDCLLPSLHCGPRGACVACTTDAHCVTPGLPRCDTARNVCDECSTTTDCGTGMVCHGGRCAPSCSPSVTCPASAPICDDGWCSQCDDGEGCLTSNVGPYCVGHMCTECATDLNCGNPTPHCDPTVHECVQCALNTDCPAATPLCDLAVGRCAAVP